MKKRHINSWTNVCSCYTDSWIAFIWNFVSNFTPILVKILKLALPDHQCLHPKINTWTKLLRYPCLLYMITVWLVPNEDNLSRFATDVDVENVFSRHDAEPVRIHSCKVHYTLGTIRTWSHKNRYRWFGFRRQLHTLPCVFSPEDVGWGWKHPCTQPCKHYTKDDWPCSLNFAH